MTETLIELAERAGDELRACILWDADTRFRRAEEYRSALARQMAEDATGVTFNQARLTSIYSRSQLTPAIVEASRLYQSALMAAYREVPETFLDLLNYCDALVRDARRAA